MANPELPDLLGTLDDLHGTLRIVENLIANPTGIWIDFGYLGPPDRGIHMRRLKLMAELVREKIAKVEGLSSSRSKKADARKDEQREKAKAIMAEHPKLTPWEVARMVSEDRHDEADKLELDKRDAHLRGWMDRTIHENIVDLFP